MGAACCRCQQVAFEDDALRYASSTSVRRERESSAPLVSSTRATRPASTSSSVRQRTLPPRGRARLPSRQSLSMNHSLANYVSFPFPFANKAPARRSPSGNGNGNQPKKSKGEKKKNGNRTRNSKLLDMAPEGLGDHFTRDERDGKMTPLSLVDLCVRRVSASLVADPDSYTSRWRSTGIPSEVANAVLKHLKHHEALTKPHFRLLARFLFQEWDLSHQLEVDSAWFDGVAIAPLQYIKSIDFSNCPNLESLGSDRWLQVDELPNLTSASFRDCTKLSKSVPDILQSSSRLTALNLAGCRNIDDRSLLALRRLFRLRSLDLSGCSEVTDEGFKCLTSLSKMETLVLSRCTKLTDHAFEDVELAFPTLRHLDVAHCRITDGALAHFGHVVSLTTLIVRGCRHISDVGMERLASLKSLQHFDARHCEDIRSVRAEWTDMRVLLLTRTAFSEAESGVLRSMEHLEELDLKACRILKRGFEFVSKLTALKKLSLAETALTDSAFLQICRGVRGLVELDISHTEISDAGSEGLSCLLDLESLRMDTSGITNRSLVNVSCLAKLRRLDLFGTNISDNGILHLTGLKELQELEICSGAITDRGVELLSRVKSLRTLNLSQNRNINAKGLLCLRGLTELKHLNLSNTGISAVSLRHLHALQELESLSIYGCELTGIQIELLQELLPKLRCLRCS